MKPMRWATPWGMLIALGCALLFAACGGPTSATLTPTTAATATPTAAPSSNGIAYQVVKFPAPGTRADGPQVSPDGHDIAGITRDNSGDQTAYIYTIAGTQLAAQPIGEATDSVEWLPNSSGVLIYALDGTSPATLLTVMGRMLALRVVADIFFSNDGKWVAGLTAKSLLLVGLTPTGASGADDSFTTLPSGDFAEGWLGDALIVDAPSATSVQAYDPTSGQIRRVGSNADCYNYPEETMADSSSPGGQMLAVASAGGKNAAYVSLSGVYPPAPSQYIPEVPMVWASGHTIYTVSGPQTTAIYDPISGHATPTSYPPGAVVAASSTWVAFAPESGGLEFINSRTQAMLPVQPPGGMPQSPGITGLPDGQFVLIDLDGPTMFLLTAQ